MEKITALVVSVILLAALGCARKDVSAPPVEAGEAVSMQARSYSFEPNVIQARSGQPLTLRVHNPSGSTHNITVRDPNGQVLVSQDLPPGSTTTVRVDLGQPGTYPFDCAKMFHSTLGMTGRIEAR